jgi:hypothetical protein
MVEMNALKRLQPELEAALANNPKITSIGIGFGAVPGSYAFHVGVRDVDALKDVPKSFHGAQVVTEVVGRARARR